MFCLYLYYFIIIDIYIYIYIYGRASYTTTKRTWYETRYN